jgi:hypothetical protein
LDNPHRIGKRKAIAIAKETYGNLCGPQTQKAATGSAGSSAAAGSVVFDYTHHVDDVVV